MDVLDIPCGLGRHSLFLAEQGNRATAMDNDACKLATADSNWKTMNSVAGSHNTIKADIESPLPLELGSFDLVLVIHYVSKMILNRVTPLVRVGGYFIFETYGDQGENWRGLPPVEWATGQLSGFTILESIRKTVAKSVEPRETVKIFAQRMR